MLPQKKVQARPMQHSRKSLFPNIGIRFAGTLLLLSALTACSSLPVPQFPGVYKIAIAQGNIITQEMIDQLEPGMTRRQVIFVMGTPLVRDPYKQDRWDYVFNYQPGGGVRGQERVTLLFENDQLISMSGDFEPGPESAWHQNTNNTADAAQDNNS
jgi:outer membrane protein assembly factor BamE (lipoprotein component of BamABCDE complex)